jgi:hypothetical protein
MAMYFAAGKPENVCATCNDRLIFVAVIFLLLGGAVKLQAVALNVQCWLALVHQSDREIVTEAAEPPLRQQHCLTSRKWWINNQFGG